jgi:signal transduction histidine kinase
MNINTGELRRLSEQMSPEILKKLGFTPVPEELQNEAEKELGEKESVIVDMQKDTPLVAWAKAHRKADNKKARAKMAKASKRRNRR